jgi:hypothetical protein
MDKFMQDLNKGLEATFVKQAQKAGKMIHENYVRQAMEIMSPEVAALGPDNYLPRLQAYSFGAGHTLYKLDSSTQNDGEPIVYVPALKSEMVDGKLSISPDGDVRTGAGGEQAFRDLQAQFNVEG